LQWLPASQQGDKGNARLKASTGRMGTRGNERKMVSLLGTDGRTDMLFVVPDFAFRDDYKLPSPSERHAIQTNVASAIPM